MAMQTLAVPLEQLAAWVRDARQRTVELVADLTDDQLMGPRLSLVNPLLWEIGHMAWFQEKWVLRHVCGEAPLRADADSLYDSMAIPHDTRWDLPLPSREATLAYMYAVRDRVLDKLRGTPGDDLVYHVLYSTFHEDMHGEAFTYTRQTLEYPAPRLSGVPDRANLDAPADPQRAGRVSGDAEVPGGTVLLGAAPDAPFAFDNEKWAHPVAVAPFAIARAPVTQAEFAAFTDDGGYRRRDLWSDEGWAWREQVRGEQPVYWRRAGGGAWQRRDFDRWVPLEPHRPMLHVSWCEADAFCRWAHRRLPTEAEWEIAASAEPDARGGPSRRRRRFPWGDAPPTPAQANLDWRGMGCADVAALAGGDSACGCRQMLGNVWEWTSSTFLPYPGFTPDPYKEYSEPWFGTRKVLRGGSWATRSRLVWNTWRNFFTPDRRDVWAGFRTCRAET